MTVFTDVLKQAGITFFTNESLSLHSTFRIGGKADYAVFPKNDVELVRAVELAKQYEIRFTVIGRGSNVLFSDDGFRGMVLFTQDMCGISCCGEVLRAEAGTSLSRVALYAAEHGLTGLEWAQGIPGTVGGGIYMNAGAFGGTISDVLESSTYWDSNEDSFKNLSCSEHRFSQRHSIYMEMDQVILRAEFRLTRVPVGEEDRIMQTMQEYRERRRFTQPLQYPSAGSVFKRPEGHFAGKLIEDAGLKGLRIGGAQVSEKHAGFIINAGDATSHDVLQLIEQIREIVLDRFDVLLEPEIRYISCE